MTSSTNSITQIRGQDFAVGNRFVNLKYLAAGAYGMVVSAFDTQTLSNVAIKKISPFLSKANCQRTLREIRILQRLKHENIINIITILKPISLEQMKDIYLIESLMDTDLSQLVTHQNGSNILSDEHILYFTYQLLRGVKYIHSANVLHRDLKPSNLLLNRSCDLKICDFGLARTVDDKPRDDSLLTEYVATRWYRAPEIMVSQRCYHKSIDLWSCGCILGEMLLGKPLFPGRHYVDQLNHIFSIIGSPTKDDLASIRDPRACSYISRMQFKAKRTFSDLFPRGSLLAFDLLDKLLTFNPSLRLTAEQTLSHPYLTQYSDPDDEPICSIPFSLNDDMTCVCTIDDYRQFIFDEIQTFSPNN
ncbi:unnamed protein product [Rotaria magnacalcarata]|uniref:mitogen-activated protein kinase n=1 Tax=Rotaria magnacalcarata TaxID=392030 RepID=A0A816FIS2_9BILA|nr:unnamed protein product [Rotaria magnacalcarata]CAF1662069.1 unnamed protein product [Rotaria magnacalcarata]CAF2035123.1 unnamed protein product [Rotaria magnacalcarata]CAF2131709.1 unnamed protein product [Rotaria magnacalcarata]CAF2251057.1 unnamed protein product [Rotaria magnacalcarata]